MAEQSYRYYPYELARNCQAAQPNQAWAGNVTYVRTRDGWRYLVIMMDLFACNIIGYAMSDSPNSDLTIKALKMAYAARKH